MHYTRTYSKIYPDQTVFFLLQVFNTLSKCCLYVWIHDVCDIWPPFLTSQHILETEMSPPAHGSAVLIALPYTWKSLQLQLPLLTIKTTCSKAAMLDLPPGWRSSDSDDWLQRWSTWKAQIVHEPKLTGRIGFNIAFVLQSCHDGK